MSSLAVQRPPQQPRWRKYFVFPFLMLACLVELGLSAWAVSYNRKYDSSDVDPSLRGKYFYIYAQIDNRGASFALAAVSGTCRFTHDPPWIFPVPDFLGDVGRKC